MITKIRKAIKDYLQEFSYRYLMRSVKYFKGRCLFGTEELRLLHQALLSQSLFGIDGTMVPQFEKEFSKTYGVPYAVASTSGTAAIHTALGALDLNPGDEVITAPITDLGTIVPILYQQCIPVFADIDATYNMDPADVERKITSRTKAILVVHLFGNPCDMDEMVKIAKKHNIPLIEDCAQAHVTEYKGKYVGTMGDIGCFSFQQSKHMTTGDGGMTITSNKNYYEKMRLFVDKGYARKGWGSRAYLFLAPNYRMNELTAAVGLAQLKKVKSVVEKRYELGTYLTQLLSDIPEVVPAPVTAGAKSSYWLYSMQLKKGDIESFAKKMLELGVWVSAGYTGKPIYLCSESLTNKKTFGNSHFPFSPKVTDRVYEYKEGLCPKAEDALRHMISIPVDECWSKTRIEKAVEVLKKCLAQMGSTVTATAKPMAIPQPTYQQIIPEGSERKIKIGIIGCGQMGRWHLNAYKQNPLVELAAFVDSDVSKAQKFSKETGGRAYASHEDMIKNEKLDGVSLCTVPASHYQIVLDLLKAGIHILCEKPLAVSVIEAEAMAKRAEEKNKLLLTAFKFRFFEEVQRAKELLDKNSLGRILNFRLMFGGYMNMEGSWYANKEISGGGIIMDNGPHAFDLIRYLLGDIQKVSAEVTTSQNITVEDTAHISCVLQNGAKGVIDVSWTTPVPAKTYLEIYGEDGCLLLDFNGLSYKFKTWDEFKRIPNAGDTKAAFARQIDHFVGAIVTKSPSVTKNQDGLTAQKWIESAYRSVESKRYDEAIL